MGQAADGSGGDALVREIFDHSAFASLKSRAAVFVVVRPGTRELLWANTAAESFWNGPAETIGTALFGPPGPGWLGSVTASVVPGRAPQMFRTHGGAGLAMRRSLILARAVSDPQDGALVGFAIPGSGREGAPEAEWAQGAGADIDDPAAPGVAVPPPSADASPPPTDHPRDDGAGTSLARRGQVAVLRDRLIAATDGAATLRFLWRTDAEAVLTHVDEVLSTRLGAQLASGTEPFPSAIARFDPVAGECLGDAFAARATWSGIAVRLPVASGAAVVPTLLSGSPVFGRDRGFEGFRGFGIVDIGSLEARDRGDVAAPPTQSEADRIATDDAASVPAASGSVLPVPVAETAPHAPDMPEPIEQRSPAGTTEPEAPAPEISRLPFANVVDLRSFHAVRSGPQAHETPDRGPSTRDDAPESSETAPATAGDAGPSEAEPPVAPVSDDIAFLALGEALRAQIGGTAPVATDAAVPHDDPTAAEPAIEPGAMTLPSSPPDAASVLDRLPLPILVLSGGEPAYANLAAARMLGFDAPGDFVAMGSRLGAEPAGVALKLRNGRGDDVELPGEATTVDWKGAPATLWTLARPPADARPRPDEAAVAVPRADGDERVDLIDRVDDAVALLDADGRIRRLNERGRSWFAATSLGDAVTALLSPESRPAALQLLDEARARRDGALPPQREVLARTADAVATPMLLTVGRLGTAGFYATLRDVSALRRAERDEARSRGERERDAGRLPDLLARVSHEIRTPLNAILGFAEVMMDERFGPLGSPRYREYLKDIHESGTQVVALVGDLLDLSRIEAGRIELAVGALDVNKIVAEIVAQMQPEAHRGRVIVRTSLASRVPPVMADERTARQIVQHLLSNAVKFNEPGGQVIVSTAQDDGGSVLLRIRDTGVGMTEAEIAAALEPFHDVSPPRPANGNGLGLPIARALVGANGASLSIRSRPREGTLVEVSFPAARPEDARRPA